MTNEDEDSLGPPPPPSHAPPEAPSDSVTMSVLPSQSEDIADEKDELRYASQKDDDDTVAENQLSPVEDSQPSITARNAHFQDNNDDNESDDKGFEEQPASRTKLYLAAVACCCYTGSRPWDGVLYQRCTQQHCIGSKSEQ
jgi:hypothetical protein